TSDTWLTIDPGPLQAEGAATFENVQVTPNAGPGGGGMTGLTVSLLLVPGAAGVETVWPLLEMSWWSDWNPVNVTGAPVARPRHVPALVAAPSVTRAGTEIRSARPFGPRDQVLVHDVRGRRVAELGAVPGARSVHWDGRDRSGRSLPAGVYFVALAGQGGPGARVVRLR
ncbi:MAG TPA: hypothetical protein VKU85_07550, partial [bacterium]|nr:hypothetical protein [bacterium]